MNKSKGEDDEMGFYGCYLLTSLSPRHKGHSYIGYTVNPRRRIRQHNGEIGYGAFRTKKKRPWVMVFCIYGFPSNVAALQFEWAWQHPTESLAVRKAAASFKSLGGLGNKVKLAFTMLALPKWRDLDLTVNFFSSKYTKLSAGCPTLPEQMSVEVCSMDDLPCYTGIYSTREDEDGDEDEDDLNGGDLIDKSEITDTSTDEGLTNITVNNDMHGSTTIYGGIDDNFVNKSDYLSHWTETNYTFDIIENGHEDDLTRAEDLYNSIPDNDPFGSAKEDVVEIDKPIEEMLVTRGVSDDHPAANSPMISQEVEVIDLSSPSPDYRVGLRRKRRKVFGGVIDLTKSPIFVQV